MKSETIKRICLQLGILTGLLTAFSAGADTAITNEFWISPTATGNFITNGFGGTLAAPLDGSSQIDFDRNLANLPANSTLHILAGTYQTKGAHWPTVNLKTGQKIYGSGKDVTILQMTAGASDASWVLLSAASATNIKVSDLTCDCNPMLATASYWGIDLLGTDHAVRRVKIIHPCNLTAQSSEAWGICIQPDLLLESKNNIVEECEVSKYLGGGISCITFNGDNGYGNGISGRFINNKILLNGDGFAFNGGDTHDVIIEGNYVENAGCGLHGDTGGTTNLIMVHNTFRNVGAVCDFANAYRYNLTFWSAVEVHQTPSHTSVCPATQAT